MKKFLPIIIATLLALPAIAQQSALEIQQVMHHPRLVGAGIPVRNIDFPTSATRYQLIQSAMQRTPREKNMRVLKQQMDSCAYQQYDASTSSWINTTKNEFAYDGSGNNTVNIFSYWNPDTEAFEITGKDEFTYANGTLTEIVRFDWNPVENIYLPHFQWTFIYNGDGDMTTGYTSSWNSGWEVEAKDERTYDVEGNMVMQIMFWWNSTVNEWNTSYKIENTYNGNGALDVSTYTTWDLSIEGWRNISKNENTYNGSEQLIASVFYSWNSGSSQWENNFKEEFTYDGNSNMTMQLMSDWNANQWMNYYQIKMTYNDAYTSDEIILPRMFSVEGMLRIMPVHMLTGTTEYEYTGGSFIQAYRSQNSYSQVNLAAIAEHENNQARIYPQPSGDQVTFNWDSHHATLDLGIFDLNGKKVLSQQLYNQGSVSVDHLSPGLYFYRLTGNSQTLHAGKMSVW